MVYDEIKALSVQIEKDPRNAALYFRRGLLYQQSGVLHEAVNDYRRTLDLDPENKEASARIDLLQAIFEYRNTDIYNP